MFEKCLICQNKARCERCYLALTGYSEATFTDDEYCVEFTPAESNK